MRVESLQVKRSDISDSTPVFPTAAQNSTTSQFQHLCDIVAQLRAPDGCPWDREQTNESLLARLTGGSLRSRRRRPGAEQTEFMRGTRRPFAPDRDARTNRLRGRRGFKSMMSWRRERKTGQASSACFWRRADARDTGGSAQTMGSDQTRRKERHAGVTLSR